MGMATCTAWRRALQSLPLEDLVVSYDTGISSRKTALLVYWLARHPAVHLKSLWLPSDCRQDAALGVVVEMLSKTVRAQRLQQQP
jgi:hypothetical protein